MPGRPPTPTKVLKLKGTVRRDRHSGRADLELAAGLPLPPDYLDSDAVQEWQNLLADSQYRQVLAGVDAGMIELYCVLRSEFKKHARDGTEMQASRMSVMATIASKLGLTPSDRARITVPKQPEEHDELAAIAAELRGEYRPN